MNLFEKYFKFDLKLSIKLIFTFMIFTVIGTLSHELGHYYVAKYNGYDARINYKSAKYYNYEFDDFITENNNKYRYELKNNLDFPTRIEYFDLIEKNRRHHFYFSLGGPVQTILTGTIGLIFLIFYKNKLISDDIIKIGGWILIFLSLFWLRQSANLTMILYSYLINGAFTASSDEVKIAEYLGFSKISIVLITGIIGFLVLSYVIYILPNKIKLTFIISGLLGGVLGFYLWLIKFGKIILP